jgi:C4-dicarboxylate transporter, DctQ subunit
MVERRSILDAVLTRVNGLLAFIAAIMIIFMMLAICYSTLMRFLWDASVPWVVEISSYLMLYITFLCIAWLQAQDGHVRIDLLTAKLGVRGRGTLDVITSLGGVAVGLFLAWKGALVTLDYFQRDVTVIGIVNTPQFLLIAILPIGGTLLLVQCILQTWRSFRTVMQTKVSSEETVS